MRIRCPTRCLHRAKFQIRGTEHTHNRYTSQVHWCILELLETLHTPVENHCDTCMSHDITSKVYKLWISSVYVCNVCCICVSLCNDMCVCACVLCQCVCLHGCMCAYMVCVIMCMFNVMCVSVCVYLYVCTHDVYTWCVYMCICALSICTSVLIC